MGHGLHLGKRVFFNHDWDMSMQGLGATKQIIIYN